MAEFSIEKVCQAIQVFNQGQVEQVDTFLRSFSQSNEAWAICIQILQQNPDQSLVFQLLRILQSKILYDFISLQPSEVPHIYQNCIQIILHYSVQNQKSTRIQCVLIFIYLYLYTYSQQTKSILEVIAQILDYSQNNSPHQKFLFDVLETLPEELTENKKIIIDDEKRRLIAQDIKNKQMLDILTFLQNQWNANPDDSIKYHILRSYKKWLEFMKSNITEEEAIQFMQLSCQTTLFKGTLESISDEELQSKAVEAICTFVGIIPKTICEQPQLEPQVLQVLFDEIYKTFPSCKKALEEEKSEEIHNLIKLYSKVGKKFIHKILLNTQLEPFLQTLLWIFCHEFSFTESDILMDFWIKMIKTIRIINDLQLQNKFSLTFEQLINGCVQKSKVNKILLAEYGISPKIKDEFEQQLETRSQMKEIMEELVTIIQPNLIIQHLGGILKTEFFPQMNENGWITFEACMNLISGIIKQIILKNDQIGVQYLMEIIKLYLDVYQQQPLASNNFIMKSVFKTISQGCAQLISSNELLPSLFNFITIGIHHQVSSVQKKATKAFQLICQQNQNFVLLHLNQFLELIFKLQQVSNYDNLIKGVANAICSSQETMQNYYLKLCSIFAQNLVQLQQQIEELLIKSVGSDTLEEKIKQFSKNISSLAYVNSQIPANESNEYLAVRILIVNVYQELWPMLKFGMERIAIFEHGVAEKIVRYTKHTFRKAFNQFSVDLLTQVFQSFLSVYRQVPITACIYVAEVSATVFYKYPEYRNLLSDAFENLCNITFQHLPQLSSFEENPDLTEDLFGMLVRYGRYTPVLLLQSSALQTILQLTLMAIGLEHVSAAKVFYSWLEVTFLMLKPQDEAFKVQIPQEYKDKFQKIITPFIPQYTSKLFEALRKGPTDEEMEDYIQDCIIALSKLSFIDYHKLLSQVLEEGPQNILTQSEKKTWIENNQDVEKQQSFLRLYTRRCIQNSMRG
ncbi:unnamed protein product [Paramecium primaurelia]|uniref:Exportin-1/Importin-beta-like domain-containing protein n=1 Tax=Paramecium primaurelia TaxID=5886 RepID=A0A8S1LKF7_PARPR|nr:unnamed protein product [Paramecium primaurelia]